MSKLLKLTILAALAALTFSAAGSASNSCPGAMHMAMKSACVQSQMAYAPSMYQKSCTITDHRDGTATVAFMLQPKCLNGPVPCRILTRLVVAEVNCDTGRVLCELPLPAQ